MFFRSYCNEIPFENESVYPAVDGYPSVIFRENPYLTAMKKDLMIACGMALVLPVSGHAADKKVKAADSGSSPNILYVFTDQQTASAMGCAGNPDLRTPAMDRLAASGVRYTNAYCAAPLSTPSRFSMFTGLTPGATGNLTNGSAMPPLCKGQTVGELALRAGYDCGYAGKWHVPEADIPDGIYGFRLLHGHDDKGLAEACIPFLEESAGKVSGQPFFLVAAFDNPHNICEYARRQNLPFRNVPEPGSVEQCPGLPANFAGQPYDASVIGFERSRNFSIYPTLDYTPDDWRRYRNAYYRMVEYVDAEIAKILDAMDRLGLTDNTVIIFTSDHGDGNASHGWNQKSALYEEVVNVPLIVSGPGVSKGIVDAALVNNGVDFLPTICGLVGAEVPGYCLGKPLPALSAGQSGHEFVVCETQFDRSDTRGWMVRTTDYKYVVYDRGKNREQLFDINNDPGEMVNLAIESRYGDLLVKHRELLRSWAEANGVKIGPQVL